MARIADLLLDIGRAKANAHLGAGQAWGNAAQQLGQIPGLTIAQMRQGQEQDQAGRMRDLQMREGESALADQDNARGVAASRSAAYQQGGGRAAVLKRLEADPEGYATASKHFDELDTSLKRVMGTAAAGVRAFKDTPDAAMTAIDELIAQGYDERTMDKLRGQIQQRPDSITALVDKLLLESPEPAHRAMVTKPAEPYTLNQGDQRRGANNEIVAENPRPVVAPEPKKYSVTVPDKFGHPLQKLVTEEELAQGIPAYREPKAPPSEPAKFWVVRNGNAVRVSEAEYQPGDLPANTREQGRPVTSGDAGRMADFDTSLSDLGVLETTLTETKGATGTSAAIGAAMPAWATDTFGWGVDAKKRQGVIDRVKQVIGKTLEGGVLRKEDEYKYEKILPTIKDTAAVAASKLAGLKTAIAQRRSTFLDSLEDANYDVGKFKARTPATAAKPDADATAKAQALIDKYSK